jgi:hypothetical protein
MRKNIIMKFTHTLILLGALAGSVTLSSCKKDWVCTCNTSGTTVNHEIDDETLLNARSKCKSYEGTVLGVTTSCSLD